MPSSKTILCAIAATVGLTVLAVLLSLAFPFVLPGVDEVMVIAMLIFLYLVIAMACTVAHERGRVPIFMLSGVLIGLIAMIGWIIAISTLRMYPQLFPQKALIWPSMWACLMMVMAVMFLPRAKSVLTRSLRGVTLGLAALLALSVAVTVAWEPGWSSAGYNYRYEQIAERVMIVLSLLAGGSAVITYLCIGLPVMGGSPQPAAPVMSYWMECPRCGIEQQAMTGSHQCERCALTVRLEIT